METITVTSHDTFQTRNHLRSEKFKEMNRVNVDAETTAKQMILMRSLMGDKCEDVDYVDFLPYPYLETAKKSKLKLKKWEAQVVLTHFDSLKDDMKAVVKKDLAYLLKVGEAF